MTIFGDDELLRIATISDAEKRMSWDEMRLSLNYLIRLTKSIMDREAEFSCPNCECAVCVRIRGDK